MAGYRTALTLAPLDPEIHFYLGLALEAQARAGDVSSASSLVFNRAALTNDLDRVIAAAVEHYEYVVRIAPSTTEALVRLGWILSTHPNPVLRDREQALEYARRAYTLASDNPVALRTLAAAEAESGDLSKAAATADKALKLARAKGAEALAAHLEKLMAAFQSGQPWRQ